MENAQEYSCQECRCWERCLSLKRQRMPPPTFSAPWDNKRILNEGRDRLLADVSRSERFTSRDQNHNFKGILRILDIVTSRDLRDKAHRGKGAARRLVMSLLHFVFVSHPQRNVSLKTFDYILSFSSAEQIYVTQFFIRIARILFSFHHYSNIFRARVESSS